MKVKVDGVTREYRTVWLDGRVIKMIDQSKLPFTFKVFEANSCEDIVEAIRGMKIRGTLTISVAGAFAVAQTCLNYNGGSLEELRSLANSCAKRIVNTRPTGVDLSRKVSRVLKTISNAKNLESATVSSVAEAQRIADEDIEVCRRIGENGSRLLAEKCHVLTHCNTGLGAIDYGTALGVIRQAHKDGKKIVVYVTETRPWAQGARLTTWELLNEEISHYVIADTSAGLLMQRGDIDMCIVGADRIARNGDTANKIGSYQLAVLAKENDIPFYVAAPTSTFDLNLESGAKIPLEQRDENEVLYSPSGLLPDGEVTRVRVSPLLAKAKNFVFDITPSDYITSFVTEKGVIRRPYIKSIGKTLDN
nr:S-methyl-5-thioribose-1-phosphate isomerase [Candidatus Njordarchaeum guaymaensis]